MAGSFDSNVFVNCPFDRDYEPILKAMLFLLVRSGLTPRLATERSNAGETRLAKIESLIRDSRYSIHDLSRCQAREVGEHYRLNMPFELGLDMGCRRFAASPLNRKQILVLEEQPYRYQAAISDLAGVDIEHHDGRHEIALRKVRNWLAGLEGLSVPATARIISEYEDFQGWYFNWQLNHQFSEADILDFNVPELLRAMFKWKDLGRPRK